MSRRRASAWGWAGRLLALTLATARAADPADTEGELVVIQPRDSKQSEGKPVRRVEVVSADPLWTIASTDLAVRDGEEFSPGVGRRAARQLSSTGGVAEVRVETQLEGDGVLLRLVAMPQRLVRSVKVDSDVLDVSDALRAAGLEAGHAVTPPMMRAAEQALVARAKARGYPQARAQVTFRSTDTPLTIVLLVELAAGKPRVLRGVRTEVEARAMPPGLRDHLASYPVRAGDPIDDELLAERGRSLEGRLRSAGFHQAEVRHQLYEAQGQVYLRLMVRPGPLHRLRFEGNVHLDADQLEDVIDFEHESDRSVVRAAQKIREEYQRLGFLDVEVSGQERGTLDDPVQDMAFTIREHPRVRVASRSYPCLPPPGPDDIRRGPKELNQEIDSFLEEELPGATLLGAINPGALDKVLGPLGVTGARPAPLDLNPRQVFVADVYDRALKHVRDLYRSEGYLAALVGPLQVVRRRCAPSSPPNQCVPMPPVAIYDRCALDLHGVPVDEPNPPLEATCRPDPKKGITCSPELELRIPIKPGPRAIIHDVVFDGAQAFDEEKLLKISQIRPGEWASNVRIEEARRLLTDHYKEEGYAYAEVNTTIELSPDKRLARVRFTLYERQQVRVERILIQGNNRTAEGVIRARLRFGYGDIYRQSLVRRSEELIATLGPFSTVTIGLEDPAIPATRKNVVVTVAERSPQYLEVRPGLSTGEGVRGLIEYGHRNLGGQAIQFTLRVQLGYLPDVFITDSRVRENFDRLPLGQRLQRRTTISFQFPNIFHPTLRFGFDAIDVRSNSRDFGITKDALLPALTWSPRRQLTGTLGASIELNNVGIFSGDTIERYLQQPGVTNDLSRLLRVPDGETTAIGQRVSVIWDRRDNPLGATQGTLLAGGVEHVHAFPAETNPNTITSDFLRISGRVGAYVRLTKGGLSLATLLAAGYNHQLISGSKTYPDRLFFLGGIDSLRGFTRDSLVPQDIADQLVRDSSKPASDPTRLTIDKVAIRGGDVYLNPRAELRIPLSGPLETTLFVDAGNLWVDPQRIEPFNLRYTGGSGLRFATPIGPVALDYGLNLRRRAWEDLGAFHFSIGLF